MTILFSVAFTMTALYLLSVFRLIGQVKTAEPELWDSLGKPTMFPKLHASYNPFQGFSSLSRFFNWFLKGANGAKDPKTRAMVTKTARLFKIGMIGFVGIFFLSIIIVVSLTIYMDLA